MRNQYLKVQDLKQFASDNDLFGLSYSELARRVYAQTLRQKVAAARNEAPDPTLGKDRAILELADVVEFLIDIYEGTVKQE